MRKPNPGTRAPRVPSADATVRRIRSFRISGLTMVILVTVGLSILVVSPAIRTSIEQRQQVASLRQSVADAEAKNAALGAEIARWNDPAYIKAQARDRLYFVMPGETSFLIIDDKPPVEVDSSTSSISTSVQATKVDWLETLVASGMAAGLSTQTPEQLQESGIVK